jgi:hypothetical protein
MYDKLERQSLALLATNGGQWTALGFGLFASITAALLVVVLFVVGSYPVTIFPPDAMYALAQGDYLVKDLRPYVDYFCMHGPFAPIFTAAGISAYGISLKAIVLSQVLGAAVFGPLMWKAASSRLHWVWALVLAISVELLLVTYTPLGRKAWREFSPAMWYNAISFSMLAILYVYALLPSRSESRISRWLDSAIAGFCLMGIFFTKMSFFPPLAIVFVTGTVLLPRGPAMRRDGLVALFFAVAMILLFAWALGVSVPGYLAFLKSVAMRVHPLAYAMRYLQYTRTLGILLIGIALIGGLIQDAGLWRQTHREWILAAMMTGALAVVVGTCKQDPESLPMLGIVPLGFAVIVASLAREFGRPLNTRLALPIVVLSLLLTVSDSKNCALSLAFSQMKINTLEAPVERLANASSIARNLPINEAVDPDLFDKMPKAWVEETFAALELLKAADAPADKVLFVATEANGITPLTKLKHTRGESPWVPFAWAKDPTDVPPPVDNFLADADFILRDLRVTGTWQNLVHYRGQYIKENFTEAGGNDYWKLYARRNPSSGVNDSTASPVNTP